MGGGGEKELRPQVVASDRQSCFGTVVIWLWVKEQVLECIVEILDGSRKGDHGIAVKAILDL